MNKLSQIKRFKRNFNPSIEQDRKIAYEFLKNKTWKGLDETNTCPFFCEWPYLDIPFMLRDKLVKYYSTNT